MLRWANKCVGRACVIGPVMFGRMTLHQCEARTSIHISRTCKRICVSASAYYRESGPGLPWLWAA